MLSLLTGRSPDAVGSSAFWYVLLNKNPRNKTPRTFK